MVGSLEDTKESKQVMIGVYPGWYKWKRVEEFENYLGRKVLEMGDGTEGK